MIQSFPPASILREIRKVSIKVDCDGVPPLFDALLKQLIGFVLHGASDGFGVVSSTDPSAQAHLRCVVRASAAVEDDRNRTVSYVYMMQFTLLASISAHRDDELFGIWTNLSFGQIAGDSLYDSITDLVKQMTNELVTKIKSC